MSQSTISTIDKAKPSQSSATLPSSIVKRGDDTYVVIENYDEIPPFFCMITTDADLWLFVSSTGNLTAGRKDPDASILPYETVDKIHDNGHNNGPFAIFRWQENGQYHFWEPFKHQIERPDYISRRLLKNTLGSKIAFEEHNQKEQLLFTATWMLSDHFGIVRDCQLTSEGSHSRNIEVIHGIRNLVPSGICRKLQNELSCLTDAYKQNEILEDSGLGIYTMASGLTDLPIPNESLRATTVWSDGLPKGRYSLSLKDIQIFQAGKTPQFITKNRGLRAHYIEWAAIDLKPQQAISWKLIADTLLDQTSVANIRNLIAHGLPIRDLEEDIARGESSLRRYLAAADGLQHGSDDVSTAHHLANVLFNVMRGGIFPDDYTIENSDFAKFLNTANRELAAKYSLLINDLPDRVPRRELRKIIEEQGDPQLTRIFLEYLPLTFSRRHGDPSRPWNQFSIQIRDSAKKKFLTYQGNWRDIFQNWEALALSFPQYLDSMISKFVNASTADGYNPYRITRDGIDWEEPEPENPWAAFGYWGDHQIIYLLKLMEVFQQHFPDRLSSFLQRKLFSYANVPYRIKSYNDIINDPRNTMICDEEQGAQIRKRAAQKGSDQKLILGNDGKPVLVNLTEKLLVPLLAKWCNFIPGGGIWMNTQRPEWNDANNALVGYGVSMVTLSYMRRHQEFFLKLLENSEFRSFEISESVAQLLIQLHEILEENDPEKTCGTSTLRRKLIDQLGESGSNYREQAYKHKWKDSVEISTDQITNFLRAAQKWTDQTIHANKREDGLYHTYNLLKLKNGAADLAYLDPMLEGQVAVLSAGILSGSESLRLLESLRKSSLYCPRRNSYILYPDRRETPFLDKNRLANEKIATNKLLNKMLERGDHRVIIPDPHTSCLRFHPDLHNQFCLEERIQKILKEDEYSEMSADRPSVIELYESVFHHHAFTGRSGSMFAYEGLGSIYWHMISKLLLAVQESYIHAINSGEAEDLCQKLDAHYESIRDGLGFRKSAQDYGAFPTDPYSHTPAHAGAQQPGMTGMVKEEILTRRGELGIWVKNGIITFHPVHRLIQKEFTSEESTFHYLALSGRAESVSLNSDSLAFTLCQTPVIYQRSPLTDKAEIIVSLKNGKQLKQIGNSLTADQSQSLYRREGEIVQIEVRL